MLAAERPYARLEWKGIYHAASLLQFFVNGVKRSCHYTTRRYVTQKASMNDYNHFMKLDHLMAFSKYILFVGGLGCHEVANIVSLHTLL